MDFEPSNFSNFSNSSCVHDPNLTSDTPTTPAVHGRAGWWPLVREAMGWVRLVWPRTSQPSSCNMDGVAAGIRAHARLIV